MMNSYANKATSPTSHRLSGTVVRWYGDRGFGFVRRDDGQPDIFLHINELIEDLETLSVGDRVTFTPGINPRSEKLQAREVRLIEAPDA